MMSKDLGYCYTLLVIMHQLCQRNFMLVSHMESIKHNANIIGQFQHNKENFKDTSVTTNMMSRDDLSETSDDK